jgi:methylated-DNA-protein-cysteine methyltransferase-like protein
VTVVDRRPDDNVRDDNVMEDRERRIVAVILALGPGEVTTYGDIADVAGYPKRARLVGRILAKTSLDVPWWRVVDVTGRLVPGHEREQAQLLRAERVVVRGGRVKSAPIGRFTLRPDEAERRKRL